MVPDPRSQAFHPRPVAIPMQLATMRGARGRFGTQFRQTTPNSGESHRRSDATGNWRSRGSGHSRNIPATGTYLSSPATSIKAGIPPVPER